LTGITFKQGCEAVLRKPFFPHGLIDAQFDGNHRFDGNAMPFHGAGEGIEIEDKTIDFVA
jgi:hypothetical protein